MFLNSVTQKCADAHKIGMDIEIEIQVRGSRQARSCSSLCDVSDDQCYKLKILSLIVLFYFHHNLYGILQNIPCELLKFSLSTWHYPSFILPDAFHALFSEQNSHVHHDLSLPDNTLFSTSLNSCSFRINPLSYFSRRIRPASIG